ncbi:MAG: dephospho-CoA kinase [Phycisphaeraceae bacterium]|nr:dephospho-CoA kinase [Phycisphaeraceae bacterium]
MSNTKTKPVIGLLGGPGSGKSYVAGLFKQFGCAVIDADLIAKAQLEDPAVRDQLVQWWGENVLDPSGGISRSAVAQIVFSDSAQLTRLEKLIHPRVADERARLREIHRADPRVKAIVEDVPLLIEKGLDEGCDYLVFVDAPLEQRLERVRENRGWSAEKLAQVEKYQTPLDIKRRRADDVIDNSGGEAQVLEQVRRLLSRMIPNG